MENFLKKAIQKHGDKYDYSKVKYVLSSLKVIIICKEHGEFLQSPNTHLNGSNCPKCVGKFKYDTKTWILEAKKVHSDKDYDYSKVEYKDSKTNIIISCKEHGDFLQTPYNHIITYGCKKCSGLYKHNTESWIIEAKKVHLDKDYDYTKVEYINANNRVILICKEHGEFSILPYDHLKNGKGCNKCIPNRKKITYDDWLQECIEKHNNKYDYSKVHYIDIRTKINISCKEHGEFSQIPYDHLNGHGCRKCARNHQYTTQEWILEAKKVHLDKDYDYSKVNYVNRSTKIIIICKQHGEYVQLPSNHLKGEGCQFCARNHQYTTEEWILEAKKVHLDKDYDYSKVKYINNGTKVTIICKQHSEYSRTPNEHLQGSGCPKCNCCPSCLLWRTNKKLCRYCKPKNDNKLYFKTKEMAVVKFLKENIDHEFIHNKSVGKDCTEGHLYPDIRFDLIYFNLIVEIDEFKHRGANYTCDKQRMYDIIAKLGTPCVFIRYNPDNKDSDKSVLLEIVKGYLNTDDSSNIDFDDFGFKAEYLFY